MADNTETETINGLLRQVNTLDGKPLFHKRG